MGSDIHIICEVKENDKWIINPIKIFPDEYDSELLSVEPASYRRYDWFSILADVRNGYGFAGIKTGEGFSVISEPKGIPEDCSKEWLEMVQDWGSDFHSHSYLSLSELENFNWNQFTVKRGYIRLPQYKELRDTNQSPGCWSGDISGGDIIKIDEDQANNILDNDEEVQGNIYVNYHWTIEYSEWFKNEIKYIIDPMKELIKQYEDVRIVFAFDS